MAISPDSNKLREFLHAKIAKRKKQILRSGNLRTTQYQGRSRSKTIGSILLMSKDNSDFSLNNIQDPVGLANTRLLSHKDLQEGRRKV